jgi:hypothetical protein
MGFYPWTQVTSGFTLSPAEPYTRLLRSLFPGVPKDWLHILSREDRLIVFTRSLSYNIDDLDTTISIADCQRGYVHWGVDTTLTDANNSYVLQQLHAMARACGAKVELLAVTLVACSLDNFMSLPFVDSVVPVITLDEKDIDLSRFTPVSGGMFAERSMCDDDDNLTEEQWLDKQQKRMRERYTIDYLRRATGVVPYVSCADSNSNSAKHHTSQPTSKYPPDSNLLWSIIEARQAALNVSHREDNDG